MSSARTWRPLLSSSLVLAAALFLGRTIAANWGQLRALDWSVDVPALSISVVGLVGVLAWGVFVWGRLLDRFESPVPYGALLRIWFLSNLARYIPGKIWQFVSADQLARAARLPSATLLTSLVMQVGFTLLAAALVVVATLPLARLGLRPSSVFLLTSAALASVLLVHPAVLNRALRLIPRAIHGDVLVWRGSWGDGLLLLGLSVLAWVSYGVVFALFVHAIVEVSPATVIPLTGINALAFLAGYLVFIAPAGLGAREAALALLLAPYAPAGVGAVVAVLSRLWTIAAELVGAAVAMIASPRAGVRAS